MREPERLCGLHAVDAGVLDGRVRGTWLDPSVPGKTGREQHQSVDTAGAD
jgi:hypothetical protein